MGRNSEIGGQRSEAHHKLSRRRALPISPSRRQVHGHPMEQQLTTYRLFRIDDTDHVDGTPEIIEAPGDEDAIRQARASTRNRIVEVWQRSRRVAVLMGDEQRSSHVIGQKGTR